MHAVTFVLVLVTCVLCRNVIGMVCVSDVLE